MQILKADGTEMSKEPRGLKLRICDVFKKPGQGSADIMGEIKQLTDKDLEDFRSWFNAAGYPVN